ncbi:hypothetical protein LSAT2_008119 [Lamellibrachia satsuma]|nr:hypothetical protein LSAT2_008119 [Lamellibrachia satsuma]
MLTSCPANSSKCKAASCGEVYCFGFRQTNVYDLELSSGRVRVICILQKQYSLTMLHHRSKNDIAFGNRTWDEYKTGFGNAGSDYWVGLKHMHAMTDSSPKFLVVRLFFRTKASTEPISTSAAYHSFAVKDETMSYQLQISGYDEQNSDIEDRFSRHNGAKFHTIDHDTSIDNCAKRSRAGWWYLRGETRDPTTTCGYVNLNGIINGNVATSDAQLHWIVGFHYPAIGASMAIIQTFARQVTLCRNPCKNGGGCKYDPEKDTYKCVCPKEFSGRHCEWKNLCESDPCQNDATCHVQSSAHYECICRDGYDGNRCQTPITCAGNPCQNDAKCTDVAGTAVCTCPQGITGYTCDRNISCADAPCQWGGTCRDVDGKATCSCVSVRNGRYCNGTVKCDKIPCKNGATCKDINGTSVCTCARGYTGLACDKNVTCADKPCKAGGTCNDVGGVAKCSCTSDHRGRYCATPITCRDKPCKNNAKCSDVNGVATCACAEGFKGNVCNENITCADHPCRAGGTCDDLDGVVDCSCPWNRAGHYCEIPIICDDEPCENYGKCTDVEGEAVCTCPPGYTGPDCDTNITCADHPCQAGGKCVDRDGRAKCSCRSNLTGLYCEMPVKCVDVPCRNNATCTDVDGTAVCTCVDGKDNITAWRGRAPPSQELALDTSHDDEQYTEHTEAVAARVNKDRAIRPSPGRTR